MKPRISTMHFARNGAIRHLSISFDESPLQVHVRLNKHGITSYKSTPVMKMLDLEELARRTALVNEAVALAKLTTGMDFAKNSMSLA